MIDICHFKPNKRIALALPAVLLKEAPPLYAKVAYSVDCHIRLIGPA